MKSKLNAMLVPGISALFVAAFFLFAALWVNGNFPVHIAISIAVVLGAGTYFSVSKGSAQRAN